MDSKDKVVLLTGATSGIGEAIALAFDREGARLALTGRRVERLNAIASGCRNASVFPADLIDTDQTRQLFGKVVDHFGRLDLLISNAARVVVSPAATVSPEDLAGAFTANLVSPALLCQEAFRFMKKNGGGQIIIIGSPGFRMGIPFYTPYACSKAALSAWTRTIQAEWAGSGVYISEYFPGYVWTDSKAESRVGEVRQDLLMARRQNFLSKTFTRPQMPETVARQVLKLAKHPRPLKYSGWKVKLGDYLANISGFRLSLAKQMVRNAKEKNSYL